MLEERGQTPHPPPPMTTRGFPGPRAALTVAAGIIGIMGGIIEAIMGL